MQWNQFVAKVNNWLKMDDNDALFSDKKAVFDSGYTVKECGHAMRLLVTVFVALGVFMIMKKRYRVLNMLLKRRWIRTLAVSSMMRIPFMREKMMYQTLH